VVAPTDLKQILGAEFRANPAYELVEWEQLSPAEHAALPGAHTDRDFFGLLRPAAESGLSVKAVGKDTALLFYTLQRPGRLPAYVLRAADDRVDVQIAQLVLDGVLQIGVDGGFVSGAAAHDLIHRPREPMENLSRIAQISMDAVEFGQRLPVSDALTLSAQMYFFNRVPVTPRLRQRLGDASALGRFTGIDSGPLAKALKSGWKESDFTHAKDAWRRWTLRDVGYRGPQNSYGYKIYVSPALESVPEVLPTIAEVFADKRVRHFKVGADLANLCRPDKIVGYLDDFEHVDDVGRMLAARLSGVLVHGVPFTADLSRDGLVSWGMDPHQRPIVEGQGNVSWRLWITHRLASALLQARATAHAEVDAVRFALERLRLEGIDTDTWTPLPDCSFASADVDRPA
jgi:hypothetical protein